MTDLVRDKLKRAINLGDRVAFPVGNQLCFGVVTEINTNTARIKILPAVDPMHTGFTVTGDNLVVMRDPAMIFWLIAAHAA